MSDRCGARRVDPKDVLPDVQVDLRALTTMVNLQLRATSASAASGRADLESTWLLNAGVLSASKPQRDSSARSPALTFVLRLRFVHRSRSASRANSLIVTMTQGWPGANENPRAGEATPSLAGCLPIC